MDLLIIVVVFGFIAISRSILIASGKAPQPKPMTKKERLTFYAVILFFVLCQIFAGICGMIADGKLDPKSIF